MRAFLYQIDATTGQELIPGMITREYKTLRGLKRYGLPCNGSKWAAWGTTRYNVHVFFNWEHRYRDKADMVFPWDSAITWDGQEYQPDPYITAEDTELYGDKAPNIQQDRKNEDIQS